MIASLQEGGQVVKENKVGGVDDISLQEGGQEVGG